MLVASPSSAFDLGFQLSVAAVAGLAVFARLVEMWLIAATGSLWRWAVAPVALTLTATAATMPLTISTFGMLSLVSPVANVIAGPLVSAALLVRAGRARRVRRVGLGGLGCPGPWPHGPQPLPCARRT